MNLCFNCRNEININHPKHGLHHQCFKEWFNLANEDEDFKDIYQPREFTGDILYQNTFFHGNFRKHSATLGKKNYILKVSQEYPQLAKTEYLCNKLAILAGLEVPAHYLIRFANSEDCFVTYNFMQNYQGANLQHIYHFVETNEYNIARLLKVIESKTNRYKEVQKFINLCLFDALIGNQDRHGRNIGFIVTANNYILSPCYDNPSYFGIESESFLEADISPRGAIAISSTNEPIITDYVTEFINLGYIEEVNSFFKYLDIEKFNLLINESYLTDKRKTAFSKYISRQYKELKNILRK